MNFSSSSSHSSRSRLDSGSSRGTRRGASLVTAVYYRGTSDAAEFFAESQNGLSEYAAEEAGVSYGDRPEDPSSAASAVRDA